MRNDIHSTSKVIPQDYDFVSYGYEKTAWFDAAGVAIPGIILTHRTLLKDHMAKTGGQFSQHEHGGTCHICGANAIYMVNFYHRATNVYIQTGHDCAAKMQMSFAGFNLFQAAVQDARKAVAGKNKAMVLLAEKNLSDAWELYTSENLPTPLPYEERTVIDIVGKLVRYGNASDRALNYARVLLNKIPEREANKQKWAAEKATAKPAPVGDNRVTFTATVIKVAMYDSQFGTQQKMTVKHADGWIAFGTVPRAMTVERGDTVTVTAKLVASKNDPTFAFMNRPVPASKQAMPVNATAGRFFRDEVASEIAEEAAAQVE